MCLPEVVNSSKFLVAAVILFIALHVDILSTSLTIVFIGFCSGSFLSLITLDVVRKTKAQNLVVWQIEQVKFWA